MRVGFFGGNGMICDSCGRAVESKSKEMVKCVCLSPSSNDKKAKTGYMETIGKVDLCFECYQKILGGIVRKPRKRED